MNDPLVALCDEYRTWCEANGVPYISADEHTLESLAAPHREWILDFLRRWDEADRADSQRDREFDP